MDYSTQQPATLDAVDLPDPLPPLVLTAFTRPDLLSDVLNAIRQQSLLPPNIIAFVDGARKAADEPLIKQCTALLEKFSAVTPVDIQTREKNLGCDQNVIQGFTQVLSTHNSLVYLEDDDLPNPYFYDRMCRLLAVYRDQPQVCSVTAYANFPAELEPQIDTDFLASNRFFSWGFGTWADRWHAFDLVNQPDQFNPFGAFYQIPATAQTKRTMVNQFWLEHSHQTDWVITFTLVALHRQKIHIIPKKSLVCNIGFGHPQSKTYRGAEGAWVNARYNQHFCPNTLPFGLTLPDAISQPLSDTELIRYLLSQKTLWLSPGAFFYLLPQIRSVAGMVMLIKFFVMRLPLFFKHSANQ